MNKLTRSAIKLDSFIKILFVLTIIIAIIAIIGIAAWVYIFNSSMPVEFSSSLSLGFVQFLLNPKYLPSRSVILTQYFSSMFMGLVIAIIMLFRLKIIRNILKPMKTAEPFHQTVSNNLKKLGWIEILSGILVNIIQMIQILTVTFGYNLQSIFIGDSITHLTMTMKFDLTFILLACVLFLASYIFRYGEELQRLSDETL